MLITHLLFLAFAFCAISLISLLLLTLSLFVFSTSTNEELSIERFYAYECGYNNFSDARESFDIKFYLVSILFLIFDLEVALLMPLASTVIAANVVSIFSTCFFLLILTVGFVYEWKKGGLDW